MTHTPALGGPGSTEPTLELDAATNFAGWGPPRFAMPLTQSSTALTGSRSPSRTMIPTHYRTLLEWGKSANFVWGGADDVFGEEWGREWLPE